MYKSFFKPFLDLSFSLIGLVIISPIFLFVWIWLSFANKGTGPFFYQERPGKDEKIFKVIKFRTMTDERDNDGKLLPDLERLTRVGNFLRKTSLDEIPQLLNVIKGDMSLIGPRPLLISYLELYNEFERKRHNVRPGITGWAQVNGRNAISWSDKFRLDVYYVKNVSFKLDCKIVYMTIRNVLTSKDISITPVQKLVDEKKEKHESN